jgi:hypothetical protein
MDTRIYSLDSVSTDTYSKVLHMSLIGLSHVGSDTVIVPFLCNVDVNLVVMIKPLVLVK